MDRIERRSSTELLGSTSASKQAESDRSPSDNTYGSLGRNDRAESLISTSTASSRSITTPPEASAVSSNHDAGSTLSWTPQVETVDEQVVQDPILHLRHQPKSQHAHTAQRQQSIQYSGELPSRSLPSDTAIDGTQHQSSNNLLGLNKFESSNFSLGVRSPFSFLTGTVSLATPSLAAVVNDSVNSATASGVDSVNAYFEAFEEEQNHLDIQGNPTSVPISTNFLRELEEASSAPWTLWPNDKFPSSSGAQTPRGTAYQALNPEERGAAAFLAAATVVPSHYSEQQRQAAAAALAAERSRAAFAQALEERQARSTVDGGLRLGMDSFKLPSIAAAGALVSLLNNGDSSRRDTGKNDRRFTTTEQVSAVRGDGQGSDTYAESGHKVNSSVLQRPPIKPVIGEEKFNSNESLRPGSSSHSRSSASLSTERSDTDRSHSHGSGYDTAASSIVAQRDSRERSGSGDSHVRSLAKSESSNNNVSMVASQQHTFRTDRNASRRPSSSQARDGGRRSPSPIAYHTQTVRDVYSVQNRDLGQASMHHGQHSPSYVTHHGYPPQHQHQQQQPSQHQHDYGGFQSAHLLTPGGGYQQDLTQHRGLQYHQHQASYSPHPAAASVGGPQQQHGSAQAMFGPGHHRLAGFSPVPLFVADEQRGAPPPDDHHGMLALSQAAAGLPAAVRNDLPGRGASRQQNHAELELSHPSPSNPRSPFSHGGHVVEPGMNLSNLSPEDRPAASNSRDNEAQAHHTDNLHSLGAMVPQQIKVVTTEDQEQVKITAGGKPGRKKKDKRTRPSPFIDDEGKKRFPCGHPDCNKTFSTSGHAARHSRIHAGESDCRVL